MTDHTCTDTAYATWTSLQPITRPSDVPITTPIAWMENRRADHSLALLLSRHDPDRHSPTDALACLALGEAIRTDLGHYRGSLVHDVRRRGASWQQIADALDTDIPTAQQLLRDWADGQHRLYQSELLSGHRLGLTTAEHQTVLDLIPDHCPRMENTVTSRTPAASSAPGSAHPVGVRLMGDDRAVRTLVAALQQTAACGPATYKPMRNSNGTRAYLSVIVPADPAPAT